MRQFAAYLRRHHLALLALFISLGGTGYAAVRLPANSVGARQLRRNTVTSSKVKDGSLTGADISLGTIGLVPHASVADSTPHAATADTAANAANSANAANAANADQLAGAPASSYARAPRFAVVNKDGTILEQSGGLTVTPLTGPLAGFYDIATGASLEGKAVKATPTSTQADASFRGPVVASLCGITTTCAAVSNDRTHVLIGTENSGATGVEPHAFIVSVE